MGTAEPTAIPVGEDESAGEGRDPRTLCGTEIGPYRLVDVLGQGGMGVVFLAEQSQPIRRRVALKLPLAVAVDRSWAWAFEVEQKALERMEHAGIARVLDAGVTPWGAPYFVRELASGEPITAYCRRHTVTLSERLALFVDVCLAVQHAHQQGIVHRDLKPSNILVAGRDGRHLAKVIDFGIAAAVGRAAEDLEESLANWAAVGTPPYMSPEQSGPQRFRVDTRSDIYSLGVVLYEMLTEERAPDPETRDDTDRPDSGPGDRAEPFPRPSERVRGRPRWASQLAFELDWIVAKATRRDPATRYQTVGELADDVSRVLAGEPILARPASIRYRAAKLWQRHAIGLTMATLVVIALASATLFSWRQASEASRARDRSEALLFAADMKLASDALRYANLRQARDRLARYLPGDGRRDRRNFVWDYLWSHLHPEICSFRADEMLFDARFSPDGRYLVSADDVGQIIVWDRHSGRREQLLEKHPETVRTVALSADGRWLASGCDAGQLRLWRFGETTPRVKVGAHQDYITDVKWIDSQRLATVGDGVVKIWDVDPVTSSDRPTGGETKPGELETLETVRSLPPAPGTAYGIAISPDRSRLACVSASDKNTFPGLVRMFDLESGMLLDETLVLQKAVSVCFHPADFRLFVGGQHGRIDVFDSRDLGRQSGQFVGHTSNVYRLTCSPDGSRLASASKDATIRLWDLDQDTDPWVIQCHQERVGSVDFSPVEPLFVSAGGDGTMRLFRTDRRPFERIIPDPATSIVDESDAVMATAWHVFNGNLHPPTDTVLASALPCLLHRFDVGTGELRTMGVARRQDLTISDGGLAILPHVRLPSPTMEYEPLRPTTAIRQVDMDGDGTVDRIAAFGSSEQIVWQRGGAGDGGSVAAPCLFGREPQGRHRLLTPRDHGADAIAYFLETYQGQLIACWRKPDGSFAFRIVVADLPGDALLRTLQPSGDSGTGLLVALPDEGLVSFCPPPRSGGIPDWGSRVTIETGLRDISAIHAFGRDDPRSIDTIVVAHGSGMIDLYRPDAKKPTPDPVQRWDVGGEIWALESDGDRESVRLHAAGPGGVFTLTRTKRDGTWSQAAEAHTSLDDAEWARPLMPRQIVYDIRQERVVHQFHPLAELDCNVVIAPAGDQFVVADRLGMIRIFSIDGTPQGSITGLHPEPKRIGFSADGKMLCASDGDDVVVYEPNERRLRFRLRGHSNGISGLAVSPDGDRLATASRDLTVRLWSLTSGQPEATFVGHLSPARNVCFSPDGRMIVSADDGGVVKFWDLESKSEMMELHDIETQVADLRFGDPGQLWALATNLRAERPTPMVVGRWNAPPSDEGEARGLFRFRRPESSSTPYAGESSAASESP